MKKEREKERERERELLLYRCYIYIFIYSYIHVFINHKNNCAHVFWLPQTFPDRFWAQHLFFEVKQYTRCGYTKATCLLLASTTQQHQITFMTLYQFVFHFLKIPELNFLNTSMNVSWVYLIPRPWVLGDFEARHQRVWHIRHIRVSGALYRHSASCRHTDEKERSAAHVPHVRLGEQHHKSKRQ